MFVLYGLTRFGLEFLRDDNPFEQGFWAIGNNLTISQNLGIYLAVLGLIMITIFSNMKPIKISLYGLTIFLDIILRVQEDHRL